MKRALLRMAGGTAVGLLAALTIIGPVYGDTMRTDVTDLKVMVDPVHGKVGDTISVDLGLYDLGPSTAVEGTVTRHVVAPSGTELTDDFASRPYCHVATPGHEVSCTNIAQFWPPEYVNNAALLDYGWTVHLKIVSPEVSPGRYDVTYANGDTNPGNNSAAIVVTVDSVTTSPSSTQSPTATPSQGASPIHTPPQSSRTPHGTATTYPSADVSSSQSAATSVLAGPVPVRSTSDLIATTAAAHSSPIAPIAEAVLAVAFVGGIATTVLLRRYARSKATTGIQPQVHHRSSAGTLLAATTGLRRAELCGLRWSALDLDAGTLTVVPDTRVVVNGQAQDSDGKTYNAPRMLALDPLTAAALHEQQARQEAERVFFDRDYHDANRVFVWEDGRPVHPDVIRQRFNRLSLRCGLPHIRLHDMRHSQATAALKAGVHLKIVSARLGHASETFTASVYQHALPGMDREAAGTIAALFLGEAPDGTVSGSVSKEDENGQPDDL